MKIAVQKFGGSSVANDENREEVAKKIIKQYEAGYKTVVVVSAIGREGAPYATDTLLKIIGKNPIDLREKDLLLSCGEIISAVVLSCLLNKKGYETIVLTGFQAGIITNKQFGKADVLKINCETILENLKKSKIVIVAGFQGATEDGEITTLGRGGSDTTAVLLGEALNCEYVEIFTDVDGVMTADPKIVPDARVLERLSYSEIYQLAEEGAKVIHPRAVEIAERSHIKIIVRNTLNEYAGTIIMDYDNLFAYNNCGKKIVSAITYKKNRAQIIIEDCNASTTVKFMYQISKKNISIDLINFFIDQKIFTIDEDNIEHIESILKSDKYHYNIIRDCCKLSIIGNKMRGIPGVMARVVKSLTKEQIEILQTTDSYTTIWCLIKTKDLEKAINALHSEFNLSKLYTKASKSN